MGGHRLAPAGVGRLPPDPDEPALAGQAQRHAVPGELENAPQPRLAQESRGVDMKTPGVVSPGVALSLDVVVQGQPPLPCRAVDVVASVLTALSEPVRAEMVLLHWA